MANQPQRTGKEYALSDTDIQEVLKDMGEPVTKIFKYPELGNVYHIDELLDRHGRAIMLFLTEGEDRGHWISLLKKGDTIELFDPYGYAPDTQQVKLGGSKEDMIEWGQDSPLLKDLVKRNGYKLVWNNKQRQPLSPDTNTCGRHSVMRLLFHKLSLPEYQKLIDKTVSSSGVSADDLATYLTNLSLE